MSTNRKTDSRQDQETGFSRIEKLHPAKTFLFFGLVGSSVLFLAVAFVYLITISRNGVPDNFQFPKAFSVSTVLMLVSSYFITGLVKGFRNDSFSQIKIALAGTLASGTLFCLAQAAGLYKMIEAGFFISSNVGVSYLYIITGMHFLHVAGGLIYLLILTAQVFGKSKDMVQSLLYFSDELHLTRFQLISVYWHFVDAMWVLLFFMFLFSF